MNKKWMRNIIKNWYKYYFMLAVFIIGALYGVQVEKEEIFPYRIVSDAAKAFKDWRKNFKHYSKIRPGKFIKKARYEGEGVTTFLPDETYDGVTLIASMWDHTNGMDLIDMDGSVIHSWRVSFNEIWPEAPHFEDKISDWDTDIHGVLLYPNGDVIFNFEYSGLVKIDKNSNVIWKLPHQTHHSIYEDADGNLWVPGKKRLTEPVKRLPLLKPPIIEEFILKISPEGKILKELSILDVFYNSGEEALLSANGASSVERVGGDLTHINDIEILEESIANKFPQFKAGDIMVSMRHLNLVVVIDAVTEKIKWSMTGPYIRQHDPDFLDNGQILVFDNRFDAKGGKVLGGSRILSIDPRTREVNVVYEGNDKNRFYTGARGKQQRLPNGNILIVEQGAGRAFEVTPSGKMVWSYINRYDEDEVYGISEAIRFPKFYKNFAGGIKNANKTKQ